MKIKIFSLGKSLTVIISFVGIITCMLCLTACGSTDPSKLIFSHSPYVEDKPLSQSDYNSFNFKINKNGSYSFDFTMNRFSIASQSHTAVNFDKVEGTWEFIGKFDQQYKVYKSNAKLASVTKNQSLAIYKLNGLVGGFYANVEDDGTITKEVDTYQGYCVYRYGDKHSWTIGKTEVLCIFFTNEIIDETFLNKSIDNGTLSTAWDYGSIGTYNYSHLVKA
ncbi:MAG: hypothetical protein IJS74_01900 [Clostridia bacterium]|nr:hypothetical protein [Clostridia bacterium]